MLDRDYDVLHGFGFEYIVRDIERFLEGESDSAGQPVAIKD